VLDEPALRRGIVLGRLVRSWERVVGPRLAEETTPWEVGSGELVVAASTAGWAAQVRFLAADLCRRANEELGADRVRSVRVIVRPTAGSKGSEPLRRNDSGMSSGDAKLS
jgi:predicted nucleic acid-binding Zn ribbon protein